MKSGIKKLKLKKGAVRAIIFPGNGRVTLMGLPLDQINMLRFRKTRSQHEAGRPASDNVVFDPEDDPGEYCFDIEC